ncbi:MAG: Type II secretion system protein E, partial [Parcubacteria group bacterium GW2011_GWA1_59_11]
MTTEQLLQELRKGNYLREEALTKLQRDALLSGRSLEDLIYEKRLVDDSKMAELKSRVLNVPYQKVDFTGLDSSVLGQIPEETVRTYGVAPLARKDDLLVVGMLHPDDVKGQEALRFIANQSRLNLGVYLISYSDWREMLRLYSPYKSNIEAAVRSLNLKPGETISGRRVVRLDEDLAKGGEEAPVIKIVADTFAEAIQGRASDIHFEPQESYLRIRFRVDGDLKEAASLPIELAQPIISRVKVISNLKIDETRIPQDGRFRSRILDREIDFRIATFPTPLGEKVAIRVLDSATGLKNFSELGLVGRNLEMVQSGLDKPFGMILVTGPTGSGKTTTLYALLQQLNQEEVNIVSLEDPVEYFVSGVNQSQVRPEIGYDFASGLRQILRQDPDVIMVGEIRDNETAALAVQAALTGHIVLSTLHTNNAAGVIPRLIDMRVEPFLLPVSLNLMMAQRLIGRLCDNCKKAEEAPAPLAKVIEESLQGVGAEIAGKYKKPYLIYHAPGCEKCRNKGVVGRIGVFEVLQMSPGLEDVIAAGPTV